MLPSTGYFKTINCPFYENGSCERPYCHFKHSRKVEDAASTSSAIATAPCQIIAKPQNAAATSVATTNPDVLQKLVSEAVKRVLVDQNVSAAETFSENIVSQVVESLKPTLNSSGLPTTSTNNLEQVSQKPVIGKHIGVPILPMTKPVPCVYNPTPIAELKKRHIPIPPYMPTRESKVAIKRKSPDSTRSWMSVIRGTNIDVPEMVYKPTMISQTNTMDVDTSVHGYVPTNKFDSAKIYEEDKDSDYIVKASRKELYQPKPKKRREEYVPRKVKVPLKAVQHLEDEDVDEFSKQYDIMDEIISNSKTNSTTLENEASTNFMDIEPQFSDDNDDTETNKEKLTREAQKLDNKDKEKTTYLEEKENKDVKGSSESSLKDDIKCKSKEDKVNEKTDSKCQNRDDSKSSKSSSSEKSSKEESKRSKDKHRSEHRSDSKRNKEKEKEKDKHKHSSKSSDKERSSRDEKDKSKSRDGKSSKDENRSKDETRSSKEVKRSMKEETRSKENRKESNRDSSKESSKESSHRSKRDSRNEKDKDLKIEKYKELKSDKNSDSYSKDNSKKSKHKSDKHDKHKSKSSSSDCKSKSHRHKSSEKHDVRTSHKSTNKSSKKSSREKEESISEESEINSSIEDQFEEVDINEDLFEMFDSDHDVEEECLRIFQEYKESDNRKDEKPIYSKPECEDVDDLGKKRVAHPSADSSLIRHVGPSQPPKQLVNPQQRMYDRWRMMKEMAAKKVAERAAAKQLAAEQSAILEAAKTTGFSLKQRNQANQINGNNRVRIAHVPNAMELILEKQKILENIAKREFKTVAQTKKAGPRVAHIPQTVPQLIRPEPLQSSSQKFPLNIRQHYVNIMQDICVQIYTNAEDAAQRALREELACLERCKALSVYKSSCMLAAHRLRKEIEQSPAECSTSGAGLISHEAVLAGKSKGSWSVIKPKKLVTDFRGASLYHMLVKWILSEQELKDNGFPRPHPDGPTGRAKLYVCNLRGQSTVSKVPNERYCCRCGQTYMVNKYGMPVVQQNCIYHWARKYTFRGETRYMCCKQFGSATGCCDAKSHVYDHVDVENLRGYVRTFDRDIPTEEQGIFALDCEMCYTTNGLELTRITVINDECNVVYETLVKPDNPVVDYNTRFSGITEDDLRHVTTTIRDVQATLLSMFSSKTILIGHSLESDFKALRILHDTVVDTSVMFPHKNGPPQKRALKNLCTDYLRKIIQNDVSGHDSKEDAVACMELVLWKVKEEAKLQ